MKMKSKLLLLPILLAFFACEAEEEGDSLVGTWEVTGMDYYSGSSCTGTPVSNLDSVASVFGDNFNITSVFTEDDVTTTMDASLSAEDICGMMGATLSGDSCGLAIGTFTFNMPVDSVCFNMGGSYANSTCSVTDVSVSDYTTDGDVITFTTYAGTDSAEVETGNWSITNDILTITTSDDTSCTRITYEQ
tara:strand:- start:314 stop:883 length:570 start_codon:yes stop_codon:yes gene_type:complete